MEIKQEEVQKETSEKKDAITWPNNILNLGILSML